MLDDLVEDDQDDRHMGMPGSLPTCGEDVPENMPQAGLWHDQCPGNTTHILNFPGPAGSMFGHAQTHFEVLQLKRESQKFDLYHPFTDPDEWALAEMLMTSGMSLKQIDKLLKLPIMRDRTHTSDKYKQTLLEKINTLPGPATDFQCTNMRVGLSD
ncbi:hypothetical protein K439DRAFT_1613273 [Ramaria rubella]|nr:hypothetical protein K439DRAFT_1613273 [Ramaria rubella]